MPQGRPSKSLTVHQIAALEAYRRANGNLGLPVLNRTMASPFKWRTLQRAMEGKPIWELNAEYIVFWIARYCAPVAEPTPAVDGKLAAAGKDA